MKLLVEILIGLVASSLFVPALVAVLCRSHVRELWQVYRSRGEEAGVPEERDDEMAVRIDPNDRRAVAAVFGEYAREIEDLYVIEVDR